MNNKNFQIGAIYNKSTVEEKSVFGIKVRPTHLNELFKHVSFDFSALFNQEGKDIFDTEVSITFCSTI